MDPRERIWFADLSGRLQKAAASANMLACECLDGDHRTIANPAAVKQRLRAALADVDWFVAENDPAGYLPS